MSVDASRRRVAALLLPTWLVLGAFLLLPLLIVFVISFAQRGTYGGIAPIEDLVGYITSGQFLANYRRTFDPLFLGILWRSLWMATLTAALTLLISYPMAYYIAVVAAPRRKPMLLALCVIPFWTSFLIRTYAWMLILRAEGLVNTVLQWAGVIDQPLNLLYTQTAVMIGLVYGELPFMILPLYAALEKMDRSLLEASADLGAGAWSTFWRVTVPLSAPGIAAGLVLVFIPSIGQFVVSDLLGGARSMLIGNLIHNQFFTARDQPFGSALAFQLILLVVALMLIHAWRSRPRSAP
jgi:spermidine/putrescine transport system permease protein